MRIEVVRKRLPTLIGIRLELFGIWIAAGFITRDFAVVPFKWFYISELGTVSLWRFRFGVRRKMPNSQFAASEE